MQQKKYFKTLTTILILVVVMLMLIPQGASYAQSAKDFQEAMQNGEELTYGTNPFEGEEEQGQQLPDTAKKEAVLRKPLESYFFSDSLRAQGTLKWTLKRDLNEIEFQKLDTTLTDWRIDYSIQKEGVGDMYLGGLGQASQPIDYFERPNYFNFSFVESYNSYIYDMESAPFYNVKKPFTQLNYIESGAKTYREANFSITHAQNISPSTGFSLSYKSPGTKGLYQRQDTKNHNLALTFSHTGKRYSLHAGYINNNIEVEESGGVVADWMIRDTVFDLSIGIPTKLGDAEAKNQYRNNSFFVVQSYGVPLVPMSDYDFSMEQLPSVYFGHSFEYSSWSKSYTDVRATYEDERGEIDSDGNFVTVEDEYYDDWFINGYMSRDSLYEQVISNRLFVQAQPWDRHGAVGTLSGGLGVDVHTYSQFVLDDYLSGAMQIDRETSWYVYGDVKGMIRRQVDWGGHVKIYPSGYRGGDTSLGGDLSYITSIGKHPVRLSGSFDLDIQSPSYWENKLFSNHYVWENDFEAETQTSLKAKLEIPSFGVELSFSQSVVSDKIYYDANAYAAQSSGSVSVTALYARKDFKVGGFNFGHRLLFQSTSDDSVVTVPDMSAFLSYYYQFWVVPKVLELQIGFDGRYTSEYYMPGYNPALGVFYNQREVEVGTDPYVDFFVAGKWKRMRIILKYQHINDGFMTGTNDFAVAHYPLNPGMFKFGISWGFYD